MSLSMIGVVGVDDDGEEFCRTLEDWLFDNINVVIDDDRRFDHWNEWCIEFDDGDDNVDDDDDDDEARSKYEFDLESTDIGVVGPPLSPSLLLLPLDNLWFINEGSLVWTSSFSLLVTIKIGTINLLPSTLITFWLLFWWWWWSLIWLWWWLWWWLWLKIFGPLTISVVMMMDKGNFFLKIPLYVVDRQNKFTLTPDIWKRSQPYFFFIWRYFVKRTFYIL